MTSRRRITPRPAAQPELVVRPFEDADEPAAVALLERWLPHWPGDVGAISPAEFFRWKHTASPFGPSTMVVAESGGELVGFEGHMPWRLAAHGRELKASRGTDLCVHPSHRRRGLSVALRGAVALSDDVALTWSNPTDESRPGSVRFGRREVGRVSRFIRPGRSLGLIGRRALGARNPTLNDLVVDDVHAGEVLRRIADDFDRLSDVMARADRLSTVKDLSYLQWRYGRFDSYRAVSLAAGRGRGAGLAIFRVRRAGRFWMAELCELFVEGTDRATARKLFNELECAVPVDLSVGSFASVGDAWSCGFLPYRRGAMLVTLPRWETIAPDPTDRRSWALSCGDLELL
jgi:GNAT superfamily N-acetyltransferase